MKYEVILRKQPTKCLDKLDEKTKRLFRRAFEGLEETPFEVSGPLHGEFEGLRKVPVGNRRIVIFIDVTRKRVEVLEIGPRGDIYKKSV